jgi:hypothetical protein
MDEVSLVPLIVVALSVLLWMVLGILYRRNRIKGWMMFWPVLLLLGTTTALSDGRPSWLSFFCGFSVWLGPVYLSLFTFKKK